MLLLSVSDARVCSVDMDEMSLAEEDWEAEPDATSEMNHTHQRQKQDKLSFSNRGEEYLE